MAVPVMAAFPFRSWSPRVPCSRCGAWIKRGYVAANSALPPDLALCGACYCGLFEEEPG